MHTSARHMAMSSDRTLGLVGRVYTVGVPDIAQKAHRGRHERVVLGELELGGKDAAFVGSVLRALD